MSDQKIRIFQDTHPGISPEILLGSKKVFDANSKKIFFIDLALNSFCRFFQEFTLEVYQKFLRGFQHKFIQQYHMEHIGKFAIISSVTIYLNSAQIFFKYSVLTFLKKFLPCFFFYLYFLRTSKQLVKNIQTFTKIANRTYPVTDTNLSLFNSVLTF